MLGTDFFISYSIAHNSFLLKAHTFPNFIRAVNFCLENNLSFTDPDNSIRVMDQYTCPIGGLPEGLENEPSLTVDMLGVLPQEETTNEEDDTETKEEETGSEEVSTDESPEGIDFEFWRGLEDTKENKDQLVEDALKAGIEIKKGNKKLKTLVSEFEKAYNEK